MKLEALEYRITAIESVVAGVAEITAQHSERELQFQVITYTEKPMALSHHILSAIEANNMAQVHAFSSLFLSIYSLNKEQIDGFLREKYEARKLPV